MTPIVFDVRGEPAPKGSSRAMIVGGRAVNVPSGSNVNRQKLRSWAGEVSVAAQAAVGAADPLLGPLMVAALFRYSRPRGHFGSGKNANRVKDSAPLWHIVKPDVDKIARSTLDALTGIVFRDDSQVAVLLVAKYYTEGPPGARVRIASAASIPLELFGFAGGHLGPRYVEADGTIGPMPDIDASDFGGGAS